MSQSIEHLYRFGLKMFVAPGVSLQGTDCIPVFHRWIQNEALDRLLIDVADYTHLVDGPSVLLVGYEGNVSLDRAEDRTGLVCTSKRLAAGSLSDRIVGVARTLFKAARLLESDAAFAGQLRFITNELQFQVNDRLLAPPGSDSVDALRPALQTAMETLYPGQSHQVDGAGHSRDRLRIGLRSSGSVSLGSLADQGRSTP